MAKNNSLVVNKSVELKQLLTFRIAERLFGIDISAAREVSSEVEYTPVYHVQDEIKGLVNIRGQIYLVLDLHKMLGYEFKEKTSSTKFIIFKENVGESFGVLIDKVGEVVQIDFESIKSIHSSNDSSSENANSKIENLTLGVTKLENELLVVLNPQKLLSEIVR